MRIALVHDQLQEFGGAERVLVALHEIYPEADVYTSFYNPKTLGHHAKKFANWKIFTSWADKVPFLKNLYSPLRFITPKIWNFFDLSQYDLVISSSGAYMCKGVITKKPTVHVCYLHHPPRYLYNYETAIEWQKYWPIRFYAYLINHNLRRYDFESSQHPDFFIANSEETKRRIEKFYRRDAAVIYPPVSLPSSNFSPPTSNYYLTVSRLARAKHIEVLVQAANKYKFNLKIVGGGRDEKFLKNIAGPTVEFLGNVTDSEKNQIYRGAKAFLFAAVDEEFGIAVAEAMGHYLPAIAFSSGGVPEIVKDGINGYLYHQLSADSLMEKIKLIESLSADQYDRMRKDARQTAEQFSEERFKKNLTNFINSKLS